MIVMHGAVIDYKALVERIRSWGRELGFDAVGIAGAAPLAAEAGLAAWLAAGAHGDMDYMAAHRDADGGYKRARPVELVPGTRSVIVARMNYWPRVGPPGRADAPDTAVPRRPAKADFPSSDGAADAHDILDDPARAYVSRYALGRDYHKLLRRRLQQLADRITAEVGEFGHRAFVDSAPVMEVELAMRAGLGWRGKHTLLLDRDAGSYFFLGELFTSLPLPADAPVTDHCGTCTACLDACPTRAFDGPYRLDARRCISYLTIEAGDAIDPALRPALGNRIYGCDDCQLACPWNRYAPATGETDFMPRNGLDAATLADLFAWDEAEFEQRLQGSPIRRIGHERWLRNIAVALGNVPPAADAAARARMALRTREAHPSALVREHVAWALARLGRALG